MLLRNGGGVRHQGANPQVVGRFGQRFTLRVGNGELVTSTLEAFRDVAEASLDE